MKVDAEEFSTAGGGSGGIFPVMVMARLIAMPPPVQRSVIQTGRHAVIGSSQSLIVQCIHLP